MTDTAQTTNLRGRLAARGLAEVADLAGWREQVWNKTPGWIYMAPAYGEEEFPAERWKNGTPGAKENKYAWIPKDVARSPYYRLQRHDPANNSLFVTSGEPDTLTLSIIYPQTNILNWFGETAIPAHFREDCERWALDNITFYMDHDATGALAAKKLIAMFEGSEINLRCLHFPEKLKQGNHADLNAMWIAAKFNPDQMSKWLRMMVPYVPPPDEEGAHESAKDEVPKPDIEHGFEQLWERWCDSVQNAAKSAWNLSPRNTQGYSLKNFKSPLREDKNPSARWNYERFGFKDFTTGEFYNTHQVAELLGHEDWESYKKSHAPVSQPESRPHKNGGAPAPAERPPAQPVTFVDSETALNTVVNHLNGRDLPKTEPLLSPYKPLRRLGGMARLWFPGKLIVGVAPAGMGKTSWCERVSNNVEAMGGDVILVGPEWTPDEYQMRRITRFGGPSMAVQWEDILAQIEEKRGVSTGAARMTSGDRDHALAIAAKLAEWKGKAHFIDLEQGGNHTVDDILLAVEDLVRHLSTHDRRVKLIVWDYLQFFRSDDGWTAMEQQLHSIKQVGIRISVPILAMAQVKKEHEEKPSHGTLLTGNEAQGLSKQLPNLILMLNPVYLDGMRVERGRIWVAKNSGGVDHVSVTVKTALYRHDWTEEEIQNDETEIPI